MAFILPSKELPGSTAVIHWDLKAMTEVLRTLERIDPTLNVIVEDALLRTDVSHLEERSFASEEWYGLLEGADAPSIVCIGSPRANHATEILLAKMYSIDPFVNAVQVESLPFRFYWQDEAGPSSFLATEDSLEPRSQRLEHLMSEGKCAALLVRGSNGTKRSLVVDRDATSKRWITYGIIAAQRREHGQVWVIASGLEGPASLGAAREIKSLTDTVPGARTGQVSRVIQYCVECEVFNGDGGSGTRYDRRELGKVAIEHL